MSRRDHYFVRHRNQPEFEHDVLVRAPPGSSVRALKQLIADQVVGRGAYALQLRCRCTGALYGDTETVPRGSRLEYRRVPLGYVRRVPVVQETRPFPSSPSFPSSG